MSRTVLGVIREGGPVRTRLCRGGSQWRSLRDQGRGGYSARTAALPSAPPGGLDWLSSRSPWLLPTRTRRSPRGRGLDLEPTAPLPSRCAETRTVPGPPCAGLSRLTTAQRLVFSLAQLGKPRLLPQVRPAHPCFHWCFRLAPPSVPGLSWCAREPGRACFVCIGRT